MYIHINIHTVIFLAIAKCVKIFAVFTEAYHNSVKVNTTATRLMTSIDNHSHADDG